MAFGISYIILNMHWEDTIHIKLHRKNHQFQGIIMPRSTYTYFFEMRILMELTKKLGEKAALCLFSKKGELQIIREKDDEHLHYPTWHHQKEDLKKNAISYLFYDPFDAPEYAYISWNNLSQKQMEALIHHQFSPQEFIGYQEQERIAFPASWGVMF